MKKLIFSLCLLFTVTGAFAQFLLPAGQSWDTHTNDCGEVYIGTEVPIADCNNGLATYKLMIDAGDIDYGAGTALRGRVETLGTTGQTKGIASGNIAAASDYIARGSIVGVSGSADTVEILRNQFAGSTVALGGSFGARIFDPIQDATTGRYEIVGVRGILDGSISTYPEDGVVAAGYFNDIIKGTQTWAGYFDGRGYFDDVVGIGAKNTADLSTAINDADYRLFVNGGIVGKKLLINSSLPWADYVFSSDYELMSLSAVENHINTFGHLPNVPSAKDIEEQGGIEMGSMTITQQEKIEEIYLHLIEMNKQIERLQEENATLKAESDSKK